MTTVLYVKNESTQKETSGVKIIYKKRFRPRITWGIQPSYYSWTSIKQTKKKQISGKMYACLTNLLTLSVEK